MSLFCTPVGPWDWGWLSPWLVGREQITWLCATQGPLKPKGVSFGEFQLVVSQTYKRILFWGVLFFGSCSIGAKETPVWVPSFTQIHVTMMFDAEHPQTVGGHRSSMYLFCTGSFRKKDETHKESNKWVQQGSSRCPVLTDRVALVCFLESFISHSTHFIWAEINVQPVETTTFGPP